MHERSAANMSAEKSLSCLVIRIYGCLKEKVFLFLRWHPAISQQSSCCKQIFFQWEDKKSATKHILYSIHVCPFKRWPLQPPADGGGVQCGRFLNVTHRQWWISSSTVALTPQAAWVHPMSALITVWHARHVAGAMRGQCSAKLGIRRKSRPAWHGVSRYTGCTRKRIEDLRGTWSV